MTVGRASLHRVSPMQQRSVVINPPWIGPFRPAGTTGLRSDKGLIVLQRRRLRQCLETTDCSRSSLRFMRQNKTDHGVVFRSFKEACVCQHVFPTFEDVRCLIRDGSTGTTTDGHTAPWAIGAPSNTGRTNQPWWLDCRGALHQTYARRAGGAVEYGFRA